MEFKTKYITPEEFMEYSGINLMARLRDDDNPSNKANAFIFRLETRLSAYLDANFYRDVDKEYPEFTDYQKQHYKLALIEQGIYEIRNSEISTDSGYDPEEGRRIDASERDGIIIGPNCKQQLLLCGLWCRKILNKRRAGGFGGWFS